MKKKLHFFREKFSEKYWEINLQEMYRENMNTSVLSDCCTLGFMGASRMIIFHDILRKTDREILKESELEYTSWEDEPRSTSGAIDDAVWIHTLEGIPETNFILFIGNKKPVGDLEKWIEDTGTVHEFWAPSIPEMIDYIMTKIRVTRDQSLAICGKLGYYEEYKWWKLYTVGKPDFIYLEIDKLSLIKAEKWSNEELDRILPDYRDENVFNMMTPLWERDALGMTRVWERLMQTTNHEMTIATMITMIRKVLIAAFFEKSNISSIKPTQRETGKKLSNQKKSLKKLYDEIIAVDIGEKSWELPEKKNAFFMALLNFCL